MTMPEDVGRAANISSLKPRYSQTLEEAFPDVEPGTRPLGHRVLVQARTPKSKTAGGILLTDDSRDTVKWNTQVAKVIAVGPVAFRNRNTLEPWVEGQWAEPGDYVRIPKYNGDRYEVKFGEGDDDKALFITLNDLDIISKVTGDPLTINEYVD